MIPLLSDVKSCKNGRIFWVIALYFCVEKVFKKYFDVVLKSAFHYPSLIKQIYYFQQINLEFVGRNQQNNVIKEQ